MMNDFTLARIHRFLSRSLFYPLAVCTLIAFGFLAARMQMTRSTNYLFLVWNLLLAWIPYWCAAGVMLLAESSLRRRGVMIAALAILWLMFFPNAPYIVTDFKHLFDTPHLTWWYDIGLIISFAWTGCFLAVASLRIMQSLLAPRIGTIAGWMFVLATIGLGGMGVYIGRFLRFNSWDLMTRPAQVLIYFHRPLTDPLSHTRSIGVTLMFSAVLLACYVMLVGAQAATLHDVPSRAAIEDRPR